MLLGSIPQQLGLVGLVEVPVSFLRFFLWPLLQAVDKWIVLRLPQSQIDLFMYSVVVVLPASIRTESP